MASVSTDPATLLTNSADFQKLSPHQLLAVRAYTLAVMANVSTDPAVLLGLAETAGFTKLSKDQLVAVTNYVGVVNTNNGSAGTATANSSGSGSPEGVVTASPGASYWDSTAKIGYVKDTGTGNTGWREVIA